MNEKIPSTRWLRIIVPVLIACIMSFMDRVNISFALPGGMEADLGITSQMAGVASGIFFIGYLFEIFHDDRNSIHIIDRHQMDAVSTDILQSLYEFRGKLKPRFPVSCLHFL